ncbi:MAG: hypothetical protein GX600_08405 [Dehalococcoidia bacterium]|nr:hypothetical protein [Dehalococcoidia bacterium]
MKTWKPTTAGVLEIVAGALHLIASVATILVAGGVAAGMYWSHMPRLSIEMPLPLIAGVGLPLLIMGVVSILGGISALQRRRWGLALAGGICALVPMQTLLGVLAIVFLAISKEEFN